MLVGTAAQVIQNSKQEGKIAMRKIFRRARQGASLGGIIGKVAGMVAAGSAATITAPASAGAMCFMAGTAVASSISSERIGALTGGGIGAAVGTVETIHDRKRR